MKEKKSRNIDSNNLNEILNIGNKSLKIIFILLIISCVYVITLINKEWRILYSLGILLKILTPFFVGLILAWLLDPVIKYLESKKVKRIIGTSVVFILLIGILYLFFNWMIPVLFKQIEDFIKVLPKILDDIVKWFNNIFGGLHKSEFINFENIKTDAIASIDSFIGELTISLPKTFITIVKNMFSFFGTFLLGLMIGFYLLYDFDNSKKGISSLIPKKISNELSGLFEEINNSLLNFAKGTFLTSTLITILSTLIFTIAGLKAPLLLGLICGITNIIPYVGPYIGAAPALIVAFSQSVGTGILVGILILIVQTIEGNIIHPLVMSKAMKLHPVTILISLLIFEYFFGIVGMIIAAPAVAILKIIINWIEKRIKLKKTEVKV